MTIPALGTIPYVVNVVHSYLCPKPAKHTRHRPGVLDTDVSVSTKVPATRPSKLVVITTASTTDAAGNLVLSPRRVIIQTSDPDEMTAGELSETVFAHMKAARFTPFDLEIKPPPEQEFKTATWIRDVVPVGTPARFDDPDDSSPRFQMTLDILLRARFKIV